MLIPSCSVIKLSFLVFYILTLNLFSEYKNEIFLVLILFNTRGDIFSMEHAIEAKELLNKAKNVIVLAGAGMSVDSGLKTYWEGDDSRYAQDKSEYGFTALEHANESTWQLDPISQIKFHNKRLREILEAPVEAENGIYKTLLNYLQKTNKTYFAATTNIDAAFARTGYNRENIYELHGSVLESQCLAHPTDHGIFLTQDPYTNWTKCPTCDYYTRPNVVYFNDLTVNYSHIYAQQDIFSDFREDIVPEESVILEIGAGVIVPSIRNLSVIMNGRENIPVIRINPNSHSNMVDGIANLIPRSKTAPFITLPVKATFGLNTLLN
jgi:NAD-dependent SIR2 family protein deacetylase